MKRWLVGMLWALLAVGAGAQETDDWDVDAELRLRVEARDNADFNGTNDDRTFFQHRARVGAWYRKDLWTLRGQVQDARTWDPVTRTPFTHNEFEIHELWAKYGEADYPTMASVILGRQPLSYGRERLIGRFEWSNVSRRFDALRGTWDYGDGLLDGFAATLGGSPGTTTADGEFYGLYTTVDDFYGAPTEGYLLFRHDPSSLFTNFATIGGRRAQTLGRWRYEVEAAAQVGDVTAFAVALEGGRRVGPVDLTAGYNIASGDSTPGAAGRGNNTFNNLFPTNHQFYGIMDYQSWQNMHHVFLRADATPYENFRAGVQLHSFWLYDERDFWYGAGGMPNLTTGGVPYRDAAGASGNEIGQEVDVVIGYNPWRYLDVELGYGHFFAGDFIDRVNALNGLGSEDSDFFYAQVTGRY